MKKKNSNQDDYSVDSRQSVNGAWNPMGFKTSSFDGHDFTDEGDNFNFTNDQYLNALDPVTAIAEAGGKVADAKGKTAEALGKIVSARNERKIAETKLAELGGKRSAQLRECENNPAFKKFLDPKYRRNRINDCQKEVNKRMDAEEKEQQEIVRRSLAIEEGKGQSQRMASESVANESKTKKYVLIIGGILLALYLGSKMLKK